MSLFGSMSGLPRILYFGAGAGFPHILQVDRTALDDGQTYAFKARGNPLVPATPTSELVVYASYVVVTAKDTVAPLDLTLKLFVNTDPAIVRTFTIPATVGEVQYQYQIGWYVPILHGPSERGTTAPRGARMLLELESVSAIPDGRIIIDGIETEVEVVEETVPVDVT